MAKDGKFWDNYELVTEVGKNDKGDVIRVGKAEKNGKQFIDIRTYYVDKTTSELMPGKGIAIPDDLVDEIAQAMLSSGSTMTEQGDD